MTRHRVTLMLSDYGACRDCGVGLDESDERRGGYTATKCRDCLNHWNRWLRQFRKHHYAQMLAEQDGRCAICKLVTAKTETLAIDHAHWSGEIRGLLCRECNLGLAHFHDSVIRLRRAIQYLERDAPQVPRYQGRGVE